MTNRAPLILAIVLLLLPVLYVGSYFALVLPRGRMTGSVDPEPSFFRTTYFHPTHYRTDIRGVTWFFWPLEQIDRKVRPKAWEQGKLFDRRNDFRELDMGP